MSKKLDLNESVGHNDTLFFLLHLSVVAPYFVVLSFGSFVDAVIKKPIKGLDYFV
jgi:hypothetical protein